MGVLIRRLKFIKQWIGSVFSDNEDEGHVLKTVKICYGISEDCPKSYSEWLSSDSESLLSSDFETD